MKYKLLILVLFLLSSTLSFSQYKKKSEFLYGRSKSSLPYYVSVQMGLNSGTTFFNTDFNKYTQKFSMAFNFEKPLGYRPALYINVRTLGKFTSSDLDRYNNKDLKITIHKFYDASINFSYLLFNIRGWDYKASLGLGFVNAEVSSNEDLDPTNNQEIRKEINDYIIPIQVSTGRVIYKRLEFELGYRYTHTTTDILDLHKLKYNKDKYGLMYVGFKYLLGKKDYRFYKEGECPTIEQ
jgi:hypothetical protein